jgi:hypothetical protein
LGLLIIQPSNVLVFESPPIFDKLFIRHRLNIFPVPDTTTGAVNEDVEIVTPSKRQPFPSDIKHLPLANE